jgi:hypothetical protein
LCVLDRQSSELLHFTLTPAPISANDDEQGLSSYELRVNGWAIASDTELLGKLFLLFVGRMYNHTLWWSYPQTRPQPQTHTFSDDAADDSGSSDASGRKPRPVRRHWTWGEATVPSVTLQPVHGSAGLLHPQPPPSPSVPNEVAAFYTVVSTRVPRLRDRAAAHGEGAAAGAGAAQRRREVERRFREFEALDAQVSSAWDGVADRLTGSMDGLKDATPLGPDRFPHTYTCPCLQHLDPRLLPRPPPRPLPAGAPAQAAQGVDAPRRPRLSREPPKGARRLPEPAVSLPPPRPAPRPAGLLGLRSGAWPEH